MPRQPDGFEVLRLIRECEPTLPVVVISGALPEPIVTAAELVGAAAALMKTDIAAKLLATVSRLLARGGMLR